MHARFESDRAAFFRAADVTKISIDHRRLMNPQQGAAVALQVQRVFAIGRNLHTTGENDADVSVARKNGESRCIRVSVGRPGKSLEFWHPRECTFVGKPYHAWL